MSAGNARALEAAKAAEDVLDPAQLQDLMRSFNATAERLHVTHEALHRQVRTLETELAEANEQLRRSQQLAALGEMAAGIAHEIRNPLGSIQLYAQVLVEDLADQPGSMELCRKIGTAVNGMETIVRDVLQFARDTSLHAERMAVGVLIDRVISNAEGLLMTSGVEPVRDRAADDERVMIDATLMGQAVGNIVRNAIESMEGTAVHHRNLAIGSRLMRRTRADGSRHTVAAISVADRGGGIPEDLVSRLFNPFFTTRANGTGLGLAIAHRVVDAHRGDIIVSPRDGGGTVFEVLIPIDETGVIDSHSDRLEK